MIPTAAKSKIATTTIILAILILASVSIMAQRVHAETEISETETETETATETTTSPESTTTTISAGGSFYNPQVTPIITINSSGIAGQHNVYITHNASVTLTGFEWFMIGSPSSGTFRSLSWTTPPTMEGPQPTCTIIPYLSFCHLAHAPVNTIQTSPTKIGIFCNKGYIVNTAKQCNGNGIPVNYQIFRLVVSNLPLGETTISIQATGTASNGQVSINNVFVYNVGT